jgi:tetratricopeptide (TPR) repeat protein
MTARSSDCSSTLKAVAAARRGDLREALHIAQLAWQGARERKDERGVLEATHAASMVHMIRGDSISAVAAAIDAYELARRLGESSLQGHARVNLCYVGFYLGTLDEAEADLRGCVEQAVRASDIGLEIRARVGLGIVLCETGRFEAAPSHFRKALKLSEEHPGYTPPACITVNLANLHLKSGTARIASGQREEAQLELVESARIAEQGFRLAMRDEGIPAGIDALGVRACALDLLGARDKALALLAYAVTLGDSMSTRSAVLWILCELARIRALAGLHDGARAAFTQALDIASGLRPNAKIHLACAGIAHAEAKLGRDASAAQWRARAVAEEAEFERWRRDTRWQLQRFMGAAA